MHGTTQTVSLGGLRLSMPAFLRAMGWLALATALVTAGLMTWGSWVRVSGSGLACPNWPDCGAEGTAAAIETGHRVLAGVSMILVFALAGLALWQRSAVGKLTPLFVAAAAMILGQAALGAITVYTDLDGYARLAHLVMAMAVLGITTAGGILLLTRGQPPRQSPFAARHLVYGAIAAIAFGGTIVATQTSFQCDTLPLCSGESPAMAQTLHTLHRTFSGLLFAGAIWAAYVSWMRGAPRAIMLAVLALMIGQVIVGAAGVMADFPNPLRILHMGLASLTWAAIVATWALAYSGSRREG